MNGTWMRSFKISLSFSELSIPAGSTVLTWMSVVVEGGLLLWFLPPSRPKLTLELMGATDFLEGFTPMPIGPARHDRQHGWKNGRSCRRGRTCPPPPTMGKYFLLCTCLNYGAQFSDCVLLLHTSSQCSVSCIPGGYRVHVSDAYAKP